MTDNEKLLEKIIKIITVNEDDWHQVFSLHYVDEEICYYIDDVDENALYIVTEEATDSCLEEIGRYELADNFLFVDPEWDQQVYFDICKKYRDNKPYIFMSDEMKYNIEHTLASELEI